MVRHPGWPLSALQQLYRSPPILHIRMSQEYQGRYRPPVERKNDQNMLLLLLHLKVLQGTLDKGYISQGWIKIYSMIDEVLLMGLGFESEASGWKVRTSLQWFDQWANYLCKSYDDLCALWWVNCCRDIFQSSSGETVSRCLVKCNNKLVW